MASCLVVFRYWKNSLLIPLFSAICSITFSWGAYGYAEFLGRAGFEAKLLSPERAADWGARPGKGASLTVQRSECASNIRTLIAYTNGPRQLLRQTNAAILWFPLGNGFLPTFVSHHKPQGVSRARSSESEPEQSVGILCQEN
jgi:hypothetical protein